MPLNIYRIRQATKEVVLRITSLASFLTRRLGERQGFRRLAREAITLIRKDGMRGVAHEINAIGESENFPALGKSAYQNWMAQETDAWPERRRTLERKLKEITDLPDIGILISQNETKRESIDAGSTVDPVTLQSVENQIHPASFCGTQSLLVSELKDQLSQQNDKSDYLVLLENGDVLALHALACLAVTAAQNKTPGLIYSDHDTLDHTGNRQDPNFKPSWNPPLFYSTDYVKRAFAIRQELLLQVITDLPDQKELTAFEIFLLATEASAADEPFHLPDLLFHLKTGVQENEHERRVKFLNAKIKDKHLRFECNSGVAGSEYPIEVFASLPIPSPKVTAIIPTRDRADLLRKAVHGVLEKTEYDELDIIIVDNDSREEKTQKLFQELTSEQRISILKHSGPFNFSAMINQAASEAHGEVLCLLNNDVEVEAGDWLREMVGWAVRDETGAVGAKLLYPDRSVQHAGVVLGMRGVAGHCFKFFGENEPGFQRRLQATQEYAAVTAACLVVQKHKFEEVGGFDEKHLPVTFNDVDFCLKLFEAGYKNIFTPHAQLIHHESVSRGKDISDEAAKRAQSERDFFADKWSSKIGKDPHYSRHLSLATDDFSVSEIYQPID
ncbi:MAG: glycosyltransferase [Pseudomonadota bacterium]